MELRMTDIQARVVTNALQKYLESLEKSGSREKGIQIEIETVKGLLDRLALLPKAPGI